MKNIMSVDFEDDLNSVPLSERPSYERRFIETTNILLNLLKKYSVKATFFTLGSTAENFPDLIKKILEDGHEIGSHSFSHIDLRKVSKDEFEKDFLKSLQILEKITGEKVLGFRAPWFSVDQNNFWVFDVLRKHLKYDSSVFPVKTPLYGLPKAPREIYHPVLNDITKNDDDQSFIEIPPLTYRIFHYNIPVGGGFFLRTLPYFLIKKGFENFNKNNKPAMFYIHAHDLTPTLAKFSGNKWRKKLGTKNAIKKFERLLKDFEFTTAKEVLGL